MLIVIAWPLMFCRKIQRAIWKNKAILFWMDCRTGFWLFCKWKSWDCCDWNRAGRETGFYKCYCSGIVGDNKHRLGSCKLTRRFTNMIVFDKISGCWIWIKRTCLQFCSGSFSRCKNKCTGEGPDFYRWKYICGCGSIAGNCWNLRSIFGSKSWFPFSFFKIWSISLIALY